MNKCLENCPETSLKEVSAFDFLISYTIVYLNNNINTEHIIVSVHTMESNQSFLNLIIK